MSIESVKVYVKANWRKHPELECWRASSDDRQAMCVASIRSPDIVSITVSYGVAQYDWILNPTWEGFVHVCSRYGVLINDLPTTPAKGAATTD
jgi:hypothetical protein